MRIQRSSTCRLVIGARPAGIEGNEEHTVYVAELPKGQLAGWVHVFVCRLVEADPQAEIGGLVVDEKHRCSGVGRLLMQRAEQWAREKGCRTVYLRSNLVRKEAHLFYQSIGYRIIKTQLAFQKAL